MGNSQACTCLKKQIAEEHKFEYVVFSKTGSEISEKKGLKVQYSLYEIDSPDLQKIYGDCSFTRNADETNSKSINAFNAEADQLSSIDCRMVHQ